MSDVSRLGALRFKRPDDQEFQKNRLERGGAGFIQLGRLFESAQRIERDEETDEDLTLIFAPGSSLGGARPKASIMDTHGALTIAKFPKDAYDYSLEDWEHIALILARRADIDVPGHELQRARDKPVLISWRFDRRENIRIPFLSAMSMLQANDGLLCSRKSVNLADQFSAARFDLLDIGFRISER